MTRAARKGQNEAWFRELNESLERRAVAKSEVAGSFQPVTLQIVCECATEECTDRISVAIVDYEAVRAESTRFILIPEHADPTCEVVVSVTETYAVVEKFGEAGEQAEAEDPRA